MKPIDPIAIKQAIKDGQLVPFEKNGIVYIRDGESGDCVKILDLRGEENKCI